MSPHRPGDVEPLDESTPITHDRQEHAIAMTAFQAQYADTVRQMQRYAISDDHAEAIAQGVWKALRRRCISGDLPPPPLHVFIEHLTLFTMMKYYSAPERRNTAMTTTLSRT